MRDRLIELLQKKYDHFCDQCGVNKDSHYTENLADYLIDNGVIVPPCKVGDVVYVIDDVFYLDSYKPYIYHYTKEVLEFMVRSISVSCNSKGFWTKKIRICQVKNGKTTDHQHNINFDDIGKTVFLTREEAEEALVNYRSSKTEKGGK